MIIRRHSTRSTATSNTVPPIALWNLLLLIRGPDLDWKTTDTNNQTNNKSTTLYNLLKIMFSAFNYQEWYPYQCETADPSVHCPYLGIIIL